MCMVVHNYHGSNKKKHRSGADLTFLIRRGGGGGGGGGGGPNAEFFLSGVRKR